MIQTISTINDGPLLGDEHTCQSAFPSLSSAGGSALGQLLHLPAGWFLPTLMCTVLNPSPRPQASGQYAQLATGTPLMGVCHASPTQRVQARTPPPGLSISVDELG